MKTPDPIQSMQSRIEKLIDFPENICMCCGIKVDYELFCMTVTGDGALYCMDCCGVEN